MLQLSNRKKNETVVTAARVAFGREEVDAEDTSDDRSLALISYRTRQFNEERGSCEDFDNFRKTLGGNSPSVDGDIDR